MSDLVSVIIPAYNHEKYIQETIKSLIDQTYDNIELIIVDDGSMDETWEKIQQMRQICEKRFKKVIFEKQSNQGTCITLNKLINFTNGSYIYFIASDDVAKPDAIETELNFLLQHPDYALCVGDNEIIDSNSQICYFDNNHNIVYDKSRAEFYTFAQLLQSHTNISFLSNKFGQYDKLYIENYIPNGYLIRKSILKKTGLFTTEAPLEDYWLMLQISKYAKMKFINKVLFSYRWHTHNTASNTEKMFEMTKKTREYEYKFLEKCNFDNMFPIVRKVYKQGACYKKKGIPMILEMRNFIKHDKKIKTIRLFNIVIYKQITDFLPL